MTDNQSLLGRFGTVAFDVTLMRELIECDPTDPGVLRIDNWLVFVPEQYRQIARMGAHVAMQRFSGWPTTRDTRERLLHEIHSYAVSELEQAESWRQQREERIRNPYQPTTEELENLDWVAEQIWHYLESGDQDALARILLSQLIEHHNRKAATPKDDG